MNTLTTSSSKVFINYICNLACENRAYLHKLHMLRKRYNSQSLCMIKKLHIINFEFLNKFWKFYLDSISKYKVTLDQSLKNDAKFVCRYTLFSQAWSHINNSYTMGKRDLPDIYALAQGPQALGRGDIYQANPDCPCYK